MEAPKNYLAPTEAVVDQAPDKSELCDEVIFKYTYHQTNHTETKIRKKHTHHKHVREVMEKEMKLDFVKDSPPTRGEFCTKCDGRGHKGSTLMLKKGRIQYFGPVLCKCAIKHLYFEDKSKEQTADAI